MSGIDMGKYPIMYDEFVTWLEEQLSVKRIDRAELARKAQISDSMLSLIYSGARRAGKKTCINIAKALDVPEALVLEKAGIIVPLTPSLKGSFLFTPLTLPV